MKKKVIEETKLKEEAVKRLKALGVIKEAISDFEERNLICISLAWGALFWADKETMEFVKKFEEEKNCLVYHIIKSHTTIGTMLSIFFVSSYEEEWEMEMEDILAKQPFVFVENLDDKECSEFGFIGIEERNGGLIRIS